MRCALSLHAPAACRASVARTVKWRAIRMGSAHADTARWNENGRMARSPTGRDHDAFTSRQLERDKGFEPSTSTLAMAKPYSKPNLN